MKITKASAYIIAMTLMMAGCNSTEKGGANDTATDTNTEASVVAQDEEQQQEVAAATEDEASAEVEHAQIAMLKALLSINGGADEDLLRQFCTKKALKQLNEAYEYDDYNENSIAIWDINGMDFIDAPVQLASIKKVGPNTYQAEFRAPAETQISDTSLMEYKLAEENGQWKIDSYKKIR